MKPPRSLSTDPPSGELRGHIFSSFAVIVITDLKVLFLNVETFQFPSLILNHRARGSDLSGGSTLETAWEVRME